MRSRTRCDLEHGFSNRRVVFPEPSRLVHELTHPLIARSRDTQAFGFGSDAAVDLGNRNPLCCESLDEVEEARWETRSESHGVIVTCSSTRLSASFRAGA